MDLLELYQSNKTKYQTDKETSHCYLSEVYNKLFDQCRNKTLNILEIGVQEGYSILLWADYFTKSSILGVELEVNKVKIPFTGTNYNIILADAYCESTIGGFNEKFDIIIDDGPHSLGSQLFCVNVYSKLLNPGGILIIEDIASYENALMLKNSLDGEIFDLRHIKNRADDIVYVHIKK